MKKIIFTILLLSSLSYCSKPNPAQSIIGIYETEDQMLSIEIKDNGTCTYYESTFSEFAYNVISCSYTLSGSDLIVNADLDDHGKVYWKFAVKEPQSLTIVEIGAKSKEMFQPLTGQSLKAKIK